MTKDRLMSDRGPSPETVRRCHGIFLANAEAEAPVVVDIGGGGDAWRAMFAQPPFRYGIVAPAASGSPYRLALDDASADIVLAGASADHAGFIWHVFPEMLRVLRPGGFIFLALPATGLIRRFPIGRYRFFADPCAALAEDFGCRLVLDWADDHAPRHDRIGVFRRADAPPLPVPPAPVVSPPDWNEQLGPAAEEVVGGAMHYLQLLDRLQRTLAPAHYLEIGVRVGRSLSLARGPATGIDPAPILEAAPPPATRILQQTSDAFFAGDIAALQPDLCFIDGMHWFEFALRDFINIERIAAPGAVVVIDDIFPNHPAQAERQRRTRAWTGDVWRLAEILRVHRPDLFLLPIDTSPTGLLLVAGLDPANRVLWDGYNAITRAAFEPAAPPPGVLARDGAVAPASPALDRVIETLHAARAAPCPAPEMVARLRSALAAEAMPAPAVATQRPKLSLVVVGYNMPRELPRTIQSLSPAMQRDIDPDDYEIILIDNGSTRPADAVHLHALLPGLVMHRAPNPAVSPVPAINFGLSLARGELVGVCIDGARMASPGLLSKALMASRLHERPVIGTIGFHLGPSLQSESIKQGYNEAVEDELLAASGWEADGYRLFSIASLARSSCGGWFALPTESNALFLRAAHWRALGGWDEGFASPGGGFANHDIWARACDDASAAVIMLLGEATFHQVHGGVATNNPDPPLALYHAEYTRLRERPYQPPTRQPLFFGTLSEAVHRSLAEVA